MKIGGLFIAAAMVLVLAGCSNDQQPRDPATTATPTPTSTATPPLRPPQADEDSPEGAAAFVSYWVEVSNYAAATGDVDELSRISDPDCSGCQSYIDLYRDTYEAGGYFKGGDWELGELSVEYSTAESYLTADISYSAGEFRKSSSASARSTAKDAERVSFGVAVAGDGKLMSQFGLGDVE